VTVFAGALYRLKVMIGSVYYYLDGETSLSAGVTNEPVSSAGKEESWEQRLPQAGLRSAYVKVSGILCNETPTSVMAALRKAALFGDTVQFKVVHLNESNQEEFFLAGKGQVISFERDGDSKKAEEFSVSIDTTGVITEQSKPLADTPIIDPPGGENDAYFGKISITTTTVGGVIFYTVDGSVPTSSSPVYTGPFTVVSGAVKVQAITAAPGFLDSPVAVAEFLSLPGELWGFVGGRAYPRIVLPTRIILNYVIQQ
jgi:predicted secreted protein